MTVLVVEDSSRKRPAMPSAGIDVEAIGPDVGVSIWHRRMSVDDVELKLLGGGEKRLPDPEQVIFVLGGERTMRMNAGMDIEAVAIAVGGGQ